MQSLDRLREVIKENEQNIMDALRTDLNKSEFEAYSTEIGVVLNEIRFVKKHLRKWMRPKRARTPMTHFGSSSHIYPEPYGVSLIIAPWNFPFQLSIAPIIGAIAAGNCVILKPSEFNMTQFPAAIAPIIGRSEEHTSELQSRGHLVCRLLLEKKKNKQRS